MSDQLLVRGLPNSVKPALRRRAAEHGSSMETEVRAILVEATRPARSPVLAWLDGVTKLENGDALPVPERSAGREPAAFE
ncbi:MAG: plasmid stability protein [Actinomycetia bacterium]|nr:plasmid stability protein [Actinomycetes bacterium]